MAKSNVIEIEVNDPHNGSLHFAPLQSRIRGRFDAGRLLRHDDGASKIAREWPDPIPGQRLSLDVDAGTATIIEPLHDDVNASVREKLTRKGHRLPPAQQTFQNVDSATWAFWMQRAVQSGSATLTQGTFPDKPLGKPRTSFIASAAAEADPIDKLTAAIEKQTATFEKLLAALTTK